MDADFRRISSKSIGGVHWGLRYCGIDIELLLCGILVIFKILTSGIAVSSSLVACGFSSF